MPNVVNELSQRSSDFGVKSAYGAPQVIDGVTFIPVAFVVSGFGGGHAEGADGGGGAGLSVPLGVYVRREEGLRFEPNWVTFVTVAVPFVWVAGRAIARIVRALKK